MAGRHNKDVGFVCWVGDRTGSCFSSLGSPRPLCPCALLHVVGLVLRIIITARCKLNGATAQHQGTTVQLDLNFQFTAAI